MSKFKNGDTLFCKLKPEEWDNSATSKWCGDGGNMSHSTSGFPMEVVFGDFSRKSGNHYSMKAPQFGEYTRWWFHEDDLEFYNLELENK